MGGFGQMTLTSRMQAKDKDQVKYNLAKCNHGKQVESILGDGYQQEERKRFR